MRNTDSRHRRVAFPSCAIALAVLLSAPAPAREPAPTAQGDGCVADYCADDAIFQAMPLQSLLAGVLESPVEFRTVLAHGDFGLGGMSPLDGEAIVVDGRAWHARLDGTLRAVSPQERTSVLFVKRFRADRRVPLAKVENLDSLIAALDAAIAAPNRFHAIRIDGRFARLKLRSVPRQSPPYRPVNKVVAEQQVFELSDVEGTLVGFHFPAYLGGVNAGGYHFHFVDRARGRGGHVLDLGGEALEAQIDGTRALTLMLPDDPAFDAADLAGGDDEEGFRRALRPGAGSTETPR